MKMRFIFVFFCILFLSSCIELNTELRIKKDLSGLIKITYKIEKEYLALLDTSEFDYTIPLNEEDIKSDKDFNLLSYAKNETDKYIIINTVFHFKDINILNDRLYNSEVIKIENNTLTYNINDSPLKDDTLLELLNESKLDFKIELPENIKESNEGEFKNKILNYSISLKNALNQKTNLVINY